jgi:hypothetical protein
MIRPKPRPSAGKPRGVAIVLTVVLMLGAHAGLKGIPVPAFASGRDMIRELDPLMFERYAAPVPEEVPEATEDTPPAEEAEQPETVLTLDQEVGLAMEELENLFALDDVAPPEVERTAGTDEVSAVGIDDDLANDRFESLFGAGGDPLAGRAARGRNPQGRGSQAGVGVGINERVVTANEDTLVGSAEGPTVAVETGASRADEEASVVVIRAFESDSFDGSEADILANWMRGHAAELPVGVRVHMNYESAFLTAVAPFSSEGREWELFLMFNESLRELHIVLVEGDQSVYLIDRGFLEQSRSLREGTVRRVDGEIVAVDSRSGSASSDRAQDFYNVFLSWWEAAKS